MKYLKRFSVMASLALALLSFALFIHNASAQQDNQQTKEPKFKPARRGAKGIRADQWMITLDSKLTAEEFDRELDRILIQYDAKVIPADSRSDKPARDSKSHWALIQVPEARAKQIAEDDAVVEVFQIHEMESFPTQPPRNTVSPPPVPGAPTKNKGRGRPNQEELKSESNSTWSVSN